MAIAVSRRPNGASELMEEGYRPSRAEPSATSRGPLSDAWSTVAHMAYDEVLAQRIHDLVDGEAGWTSKKMFGGLGFMLDGHMAVAAGSGGALMVRADPADGEEWVDGESVQPMEMRGRPMTGWLLVVAGRARRRRAAAAVGRPRRDLRAHAPAEVTRCRRPPSALAGAVPLTLDFPSHLPAVTAPCSTPWPSATSPTTATTCWASC